MKFVEEMICIKCGKKIDISAFSFQIGKFPKCCGITMVSSENIKEGKMETTIITVFRRLSVEETIDVSEYLKEKFGVGISVKGGQNGD